MAQFNEQSNRIDLSNQDREALSYNRSRPDFLKDDNAFMNWICDTNIYAEQQPTKNLSNETDNDNKF